MKPATQEQIEAACMTRSAVEARAYLAGLGYRAKVLECREAIVRLTQAGIRQPLKTGAVDTEIKEHDAVIGCERMLDAMVRTFQRKAKRLGISFEQAMATSLGNQAVRA